MRKQDCELKIRQVRILLEGKICSDITLDDSGYFPHFDFEGCRLWPWDKWRVFRSRAKVLDDKSFEKEGLEALKAHLVGRKVEKAIVEGRMNSLHIYMESNTRLVVLSTYSKYENWYITNGTEWVVSGPKTNFAYLGPTKLR